MSFFLTVFPTGKYGIKTLSLDGRKVKSMGGLNVIPDMPLHKIDISTIAMLVLPGGKAREESKLIEAISRQNGYPYFRMTDQLILMESL
jgi:transcriptional regulator GlxA family with amidase domain